HHTLSVCSDIVYKDGTKVFDFLDSTLKAEVMAGRVSNDTYASLVGRAYTYTSGLPQLYGTKFRSIGGNYELEYAIDDIANVDKRRAEIFLPPLYKSALFYGFDLPEGYVVPEE